MHCCCPRLIMNKCNFTKGLPFSQSDNLYIPLKSLVLFKLSDFIHGAIIDVHVLVNVEIEFDAILPKVLLKHQIPNLIPYHSIINALTIIQSCPMIMVFSVF